MRFPDFQVPDYEQLMLILRAEYPAIVWYVPSLVLCVLAIAAFVDARTGRVPSMLLIFGMIGAVISYTFFSSWGEGFERFYLALIPVFILCLINYVCVQVMRHDAFGMGDVQWTGLAAFAFGPWPLFWTWVGGACLALIWLGLKRALSKVITIFDSDYYEGHEYVHFVPFLFITLCAALFFGLQAP